MRQSHSTEFVVDAFRTVVEMEAREQQLDSLIRRLKDDLVRSSGLASLPETIGTLDELHWHLQQFQKQTAQLDKWLGIQRTAIRQPSPKSRGDGSVLRGSASTLPLRDLVSILGKAKKTGTLRVKSAHGEKFVLEFLDGAVVHVVSDTPLPSRMLGSILVARNKISSERLNQFLATFSPKDGPIGEALAKAELVDASDLKDAIEEQVVRLFERIFSMTEAMFSFAEGSVSDLEHRVTLNVAFLIAAAMGEDQPAAAAASADEEVVDDEGDQEDLDGITPADDPDGDGVSDLLDALVHQQAVLLVDEDGDSVTDMVAEAARAAGEQLESDGLDGDDGVEPSEPTDA